MTITISSQGSTRTVTDTEVIRDIQNAIRLAGGNPDVLAPDFIDCALRDECSTERIVAIAMGREHLLPRRERGNA